MSGCLGLARVARNCGSSGRASREVDMAFGTIGTGRAIAATIGDIPNWTKRLRRGMGGAVMVDGGDFALLDLGSILI